MYALTGKYSLPYLLHSRATGLTPDGRRVPVSGLVAGGVRVRDFDCPCYFMPVVCRPLPVLWPDSPTCVFLVLVSIHVCRSTV